MKETSLVVARTVETNGIGLNGGIPWKLNGDMKYFVKLTSKVEKEGNRNAVIMGRKTWFSIPPKFRPLNKRYNVILSRTMNQEEDIFDKERVSIQTSLKEAFEHLDKMNDIEKIFIIGGNEVYSEALKWERCKKLFITEIYEDIECDTFFPTFDYNTFELDINHKPDGMDQNIVEGDIRYSFCLYKRSN